MNDCVAPGQPGALAHFEPSAGALWWQEALLIAAARFARTSGRRASLALVGRPDLLARAGAVADGIGVASQVAIGAAGALVRFEADAGPDGGQP